MNIMRIAVIILWNGHNVCLCVTVYFNFSLFFYIMFVLIIIASCVIHFVSLVSIYHHITEFIYYVVSLSENSITIQVGVNGGLLSLDVRQLIRGDIPPLRRPSFRPPSPPPSSSNLTSQPSYE